MDRPVGRDSLAPLRWDPGAGDAHLEMELRVAPDRVCRAPRMALDPVDGIGVPPIASR